MRAALGEDQLALQELARTVARDLGTRTVADLPPAVDADRAWNALLDSGLSGLRADGGSILDLVVCAEEFGASLSAAPFVGAALAGELLGPSERRAVASLDGRVAVDALGADCVVFVHAGHVHSVDATEEVLTADRSRVAARCGTDDLVAIRRTDGDQFDAIARILFGADLVGVGTAAVLDAVDHARQRQQFDAPIGSFQAVQHLLADAWVDLCAARNALWAAAWRLDHGTEDARASAARAKLVADEAGVGACEAAVQVLGGLGHTWEHLASVRLRRALVSRAVTEPPATHLLRRPLATSPSGLAAVDGYDLRDDTTEAAFRSRLDEFLDSLPVRGDWHRRLAAGGFVGVSLPTAVGGGGLPVTCEAILSERLGDGGFPPPPAIAHLAHALAEFGATEEHRAHLRSMLDGSVRWCQGFSEPSAGSDLAALRTRAVADGDHWVIDGRKIWTSEAAQADMILLLCRTSPDRHRGLSVLLVPVDTPGVEVTTIVTAWGSDEFAEVSFDGARIPRTALLGDEGQGWAIAMSMLAVERGPADIGWIARFRSDLGQLVRQPSTDPDDAGRVAAWLEALDATVATTLTARRAGTFEASRGSIDKLLMTKVDQLLHGLEASSDRAAVLDGDPGMLGRYLWGRAASIFGGTSQIQRSIVAQRLLGLPRS
jgi:alkylation response protein AidB-like acyl-CoA dehydrogenase